MPSPKLLAAEVLGKPMIEPIGFAISEINILKRQSGDFFRAAHHRLRVRAALY
jgi:hypothetical protein